MVMESVKLSKNTIAYYIRIIVIMLLATVISLILNSIGIQKENILMVFMVGVLLVTSCTIGYYYGIISSIISIMIFNYAFTEPIYTLQIDNSNDIILLLFFLIAALISSTLTVRLQRQTNIAKENERIVKSMYAMSAGFINVTGKENIIRHGIKNIHEYTGYDSEVKVLDDLDNIDNAAYDKGFYKNIESRDAFESSGMDNYIIFPINGLTKQIGFLKVHNCNKGLEKEKELLIKTAANQIGIALDRELVYYEQEKIKVDIEREHMKSSMLRSISHDLRTPLTGIIGDCTAILEGRCEDYKEVTGLISDVNEQALWLVKMVENILNMTKIESGKFEVKKQPEVVEDIVYEAINHVAGIRENRKLKVIMPDEIVIADMDGKMMVQVIVNLLDNAMRYTKKDEEISIVLRFRRNKVFFYISDNGEGIDEKIKDKIFEEFVTTIKGDSKKLGIGLGLYICKSVIEAHGGEIWAENRVTKGAEFIFWIYAERADVDGREENNTDC